MSTAPTEPTIAVVSAGVSDPSSTTLLAGRIARRSIETLAGHGITARARSVDLGPLAVDIAQALVTGVRTPALEAAVQHLADADAVVAATPVYKAAASGLFKSFVDVLDDDLLIATPVVLAATGGSARHAMVVDDQVRPLFAFLRALPVPTSLYAAPEDWGSPDLGRRIDRAAAELAAMLRTRVGGVIAEDHWDGYSHQFGGNATRAAQTDQDVDFDTDLMRLAAGGTT